MSNITKTVQNIRKGTIVMPYMPDKTVGMLALSAGIIGTLYVVLVIVTIVLATLQTSLVASVHEAEGSIATLETTYYASVADLNATNPTTAGFVAPSDVTYTSERPSSGLSFAE